MNKYKIDLAKEKLSPGEIENRMNFNRFIKGMPGKTPSFLQTVKAAKAVMAMGLSGAVVIGAYLLVTHNAVSQAPFINPPLKEAAVPLAPYTVDTGRDTTIIYKTGSTVHIPAHAFVDANGKVQEGKVQIRYREFHDLYEIILSGIPMNYDSAGMHFQFESAGMLEIQAFKDNLPLAINAASPVRVNMLSKTQDDKFNVYLLDTTRQCWNYVASNTKANNTLIPLYDTTLARNYEAATASMEEPVRPNQVHDRSRCFSIDYSKNDFPELAVYDGVMFEADARDKSYNKGLAQKTWEDVAIQRKDKIRYTVTFSTTNQSHSFTVIPVVEGKKYEEARLEFDTRMSSYETALASRTDKKKEEECVIQANYQKYTRQARWDDVNSKIKEFQAKEQVRYDVLAMRTFNISNTGIWNCDHPIAANADPFLNSRYRELDGKLNKGGSRISAVLYGQDKKPLNAKIIYILLNTSKRMYSYVPKDNQIPSLAYNTDENCTLLAITNDGYPAVLNSKQFKAATDKGSNAEFRMTVSSKKIETPEELKALFTM